MSMWFTFNLCIRAGQWETEVGCEGLTPSPVDDEQGSLVLGPSDLLRTSRAVPPTTIISTSDLPALSALIVANKVCSSGGSAFGSGASRLDTALISCLGAERKAQQLLHAADYLSKSYSPSFDNERSVSPVAAAHI